jgi:hypothetical protein
MKRFRPRLTYANVIATLALFLALGGAAVAAGLPKHSVGAKQLKKGAVTAAAIKRNAVTSGKLAPKSVVAGKIGPNAVGPGNIGNGAITSAKIEAGAVIASSIKNGVITTNKLTNANVTTPKIADANVTTAKLANAGVTTAKLADGSVTAAKLSTEVLNNVTTLKSGQTLRGVFDLGGVNPLPDAKPFDVHSSITFQQPLATTPISVTVVPKGGPFPPNCTGLGGGETTPAAAGGSLCLYLVDATGLDAKVPLSVDHVSRLGVGLVANAEEKSEVAFEATGVWAVTAP